MGRTVLADEEVHLQNGENRSGMDEGADQASGMGDAADKADCWKDNST